MTKEQTANQLLAPHKLAGWIAERYGIWQMDFLNAKNLSDFCKDRGLSFWELHVEQLWQLGLLKADILESKKSLEKKGLLILRRIQTEHIFTQMSES